MDCCLERNGRKHYSKEEIAKVLADWGQLAEPECPPYVERESVTYYLHVDEDGNIMLYPSVESFTCTIEFRKFDITDEDFRKYGVIDEDHSLDIYYNDDDDEIRRLNWWESDFLDDHATLNCEAFVSVVEDLTNQVNEWIDENDL